MPDPVIKLVRIHEKAVVPKFATKGSACVDLCAVEDGIIKPGETVMVPIGWKFAIEEGYSCVFKERSGLAVKNKIGLRAGVIDSDYRGPVMVILKNESGDDFAYKAGDRLCQMKTEKVIQPIFQEIAEEDLDKTARGEGGFGSTGISSESVVNQNEPKTESTASDDLEKIYEAVWKQYASVYKEENPDENDNDLLEAQKDLKGIFLEWFKDWIMSSFLKDVLLPAHIEARKRRAEQPEDPSNKKRKASSDVEDDGLSGQSESER